MYRELKDIGLDVPQVTELAWELKKAGYDIPDDIITEEECVRQFDKKLFTEKLGIKGWGINQGPWLRSESKQNLDGN